MATFISAFEHGLTDEELADSAFRMRVAFVPMVSNRASGADRAVEFIKAGSADAEAVNQVLVKEIHKQRYTATQVIEKARAAGYPRFKMPNHTALWKKLSAKDPAKGYGCQGEYKGQWVWFDTWVKRVLEHCEEHQTSYK